MSGETHQSYEFVVCDPVSRESQANIAFDGLDLPDWLVGASHDALDALPFGLIAMDRDGLVTHYNLCEAKLAGLTPHRVIGRNFFTSVAPCTNNFMVAHRFKTESEIDDIIDYVFTFRIAPMNVRLRLIKRQGAPFMYLAVAKRA